mgnify:CR=1 FL=1
MSGFDQQVTFLLVSDLERSARFYGEMLGLEMVLDQGDCRIYRAAREAFLGLCRRQGRSGQDAVIVTLVSDDVDGHHQRLMAAGAPCDREPQLNPTYNVYHAFYRDPDGFLVEIQRFLDPAWPGPGS